MHQRPILKPGDQVAVLAPASRCSDKRLAEISELLSSWQVHCLIDEDIFGDDLLCANTDEMRFKALKNALLNPDIKAIICARGGYGSMRLIPALRQISPPDLPKLFVGISDITALHLYLQQQWQWPTIHGVLAKENYSPESIASLKSLLFGTVEPLRLSGRALNDRAMQDQRIEADIIGGNLCLVQTSIGTSWQIDGRNKIILLEEIGERGYRIDRMLEHLQQARVFQNAAAVLFGDFLEGKEPDGSSLIQAVLERFAQHCPIPVLQIPGIGHGYVSAPIPLGTRVHLQLGEQIVLHYA